MSEAMGYRSTTGGRAGGDGRADPRRSLWPSQWFGLAVGAVFVVVGVAGFAITGFDNFANHDTMEHLLIFEINPLHNVVHLVLGLLAFALCWTRRGTLTYGLVVAVGYLAAFVYGLFAVGQTWDFLSLNWEDNWLHLGLGVLGALVAALAAAELASDRRSPATTYDRAPSSTRGARRAPV